MPFGCWKRCAWQQWKLILLSLGPTDLTRAFETKISATDLRGLADVSYNVQDVGAAIASGSFKTLGMIVVPCSMRSLAGIATGVLSVPGFNLVRQTIVE